MKLKEKLSWGTKNTNEKEETGEKEDGRDGADILKGVK